MIGTFLKGLQNNEWSQYMEYLSPVFFEVVPTLEIAKLTTQLGKTYARLNHKDEETPVRALIEALDLPVIFREDRDSSEMLPSLSRQERGRILLELYFGQIMENDLAWLDLRSSTFEYLSKQWIWSPGPWIMKWDPHFLESIRRIYRGYYLDDEQEYLAGLRELNLEHAAELFRKQFGPGDQSKVYFRMKDFRESFHQIFLSCKKARSQLHPNFFAFGLILSSLYEHLESLEDGFDVRKAFLEVLALEEHETVEVDD